MRNNVVWYFMFILFVLYSCKNDNSDSPQKGNIVIESDDSFQNVSQVLKDRYMLFYPKTKLDLKIVKENVSFQDILNDKARVIVMSRDLTNNEKASFKKKIGFEANPAKFAIDGLVFIVSKSSNIDSLTLSEIKGRLTDGKNSLIFDGANSSNVGTIGAFYKINTKDLKYSTLSSNEEIVEKIDKYPNSIGVISFNTISKPYNEKAIKLRESVRILPVINSNGKSINISEATLKNFSYPFTRTLYFLTSEPYFGLGNGFIRFSCSQKGQIIVSKQGLPPYYIFPRTVKITQ